MNHKRVLRVMRQEALLCQIRRSWVITTDSRHGLTIFPNLLAGVELSQPNQAWVADNTYQDTYRPDLDLTTTTFTMFLIVRSESSSQATGYFDDIRIGSIR